MTFEDITVNVEDGIGILSFNRPDQYNTVRLQTMKEICEGINRLENDKDVKVIIIRGEGKHFCAGIDLSILGDAAKMPPVEIVNQVYTHFQGAVRSVYNCRKPTIIAISGAAVTFGCELALACDFRLVSDSAVFKEIWIKVGLLAPLGGLFLLPRIVGLGRAKQMVLRGEPITAEVAVEIGLAIEVVSRDKLDARAKELAFELSFLPPLAYSAAKQALHRGLETTMEAEWSTNVLNQAVLLSSNDFREGVKAVKEKRRPNFQGS